MLSIHSANIFLPLLIKINFVFFLWFNTLPHTTLFAQDNPQKFDDCALRFEVVGGFIVPEYKHFNLYVDRPVVATEISYIKKTKGKNYWEQIYNYPEYGITAGFADLGSKRVLGQEVYIFPHISFPFIDKPKFRLSSQIGLGLGYATKKFDIQTNYNNVSVGSNLNIHFNYKIGFRWQLLNEWNFVNFFSFSHFSNANMAEPNLGVNYFTYNLGVEKAIGLESNRVINDLPEIGSNGRFYFIASGGGKHPRALTSQIYITSSLAVDYMRNISRKVGLGIGADFFYDSSTESEMTAPGKEEYYSNYAFRSGIHISEELNYQKFSFLLQQGLYMGLTDKVNHKKMYNKGILRYHINEHWMTQFAVKSHLHILDFPEIGFGYYF